MTYFNYIFIAGYRVYRTTDRRPRGSGICFVLGIIVGFCILLIGVSKKIWGMTEWWKSAGNYPGAFSVFGLALIFFLNYYYSAERTERLDEEFENLPIGTRRLWGWIASFPLLFLIRWASIFVW